MNIHIQHGYGRCQSCREVFVYFWADETPLKCIYCGENKVEPIPDAEVVPDDLTVVYNKLKELGYIPTEDELLF